MRAFPSWYLRMECAACGRERCLAGMHLTIAGYGDRRRDLIGPSEARRLRRELKPVELIIGIPGSSAWQQRIVLMGSAGQ